MKRLIFFLCLVSLVPKIFALDPGEIQKVKETAQTTKDYLVEDQKEFKQMMDQQQKVVDSAPQEQKEQEQMKLDKIKNFYEVAGTKIDSLSTYIDKLSNEKTVTQDDLTEAEKNIKIAQTLIQTNADLKAEFVPSEPTQETGQEAQAEIQKLSWWDNFKVNIQIAFAQTKAALASFFGNKEAAVAAHKDLIDIYDQLKDYTSKANGIGQLSDVYKKFKDFGNAIQAQATRFDELNNVDKNEQISIITDIFADLLSLKDASSKAGIGLTTQDRQTYRQAIDNINAKINDFLGELGYKINSSAYEVLGIIPAPATEDEIKNRYNQLISLYPDLNDPLEVQQRWQERLATYKTAMQDLFGYYYDKSPSLETKKEYDKLPIVQERFEIKPMTDAEKKAFEAQKALEKSQAQKVLEGETDIF